jgi:protein-L-isoaspartate(D-aspartate) O-methyltransferase
MFKTNASPSAALRQFLHSLGYKNIIVKCGNGRLGWPQLAPCDAIILTAASEDIPPELIRRLKPSGGKNYPKISSAGLHRAFERQ